jgi:long-chain acyl-CoA synthetase
MASQLSRVPATLARLPACISARAPRPTLIGRSLADGIRWTGSADLVARVRALAVGLGDLGMTRGSRVALMSESRPEWLLTDLAVLSVGAVTTTVYPTLAPEQVAYILRDAGVSIIVVSTMAQCEKVRAIASQVSTLRVVVVMDAPVDLPAVPGLAVWSWAALEVRGRACGAEAPAVFAEWEAATHAVAPRDLATLIYTSGTTGEPKGVELTHANLVANIEDSMAVLDLSNGHDAALSFLPLSHAFERLVVFVYLSSGVPVVFAESNDTIARDLLAVRPTVMAGVPRVYEKLQSRILEKGSALTGVRGRLFRWAMQVARRVAPYVPDGPPLPFALSLSRRLADVLVYSKIRAGLGGRFRYVVSGSAALVPDVGRFFHAIGVPIIEGYGLTETSPVLTVNPIERPRLGTVGVALPRVRLRIADDGEILAQGPNIMTGYYRKPSDSAEVLRDGWFHTGDIGTIDEAGYLRITDRKKELLVTSGGKKIAPQPIEGQLRASALVAEAVLVGEGRHFPAVLLVPDFAALASALGEAAPADEVARAALLQRGDVLARYQAVVDEVNAGLAQFERLKQFRLLPREFTIAGGELTPTLKVKRRVIAEQFAEVIERIYAEGGSAR